MNTMAKAHLKRIAVPKTWPILRKTTPFIRRPNPGSQSFMYGMSLSTWLCEILGVATTAKEARTAMRAGSINVNGKKVLSVDESFNIGYSVKSIDVSQLSAGNYIVKVKSSEMEHSEKFVKQ